MPDAAPSQPAPSPASFPGTCAYVLLWFPLSSETFIFREVRGLQERGMPIDVFSLYADKPAGQSREMRGYQGRVMRLGAKATWTLFTTFLSHVRKTPRLVWRLTREVLFRRLRSLEALGENAWAFFAGFWIADRAREAGVTLFHAPWANGPATAAWVASRVSGIPFSFAGRAGDIYPQDGLLPEKIRDASFVRTNNQADVAWLERHAPKGSEGKVRLVYNSLTLETATTCACPCQPPYRVLAVGRFCRTKGFPYLLTAIARLRRERFPVRLTLVGDGVWKRRILHQIKRLRLEDAVDLPGFVPHDGIAEYMQSHDMLVMPSVVHSNGDRDGIPNVIMEALSHAMPVAASDVCGIAEVVRDGETGLLFPQRDARAIAHAIRWICGHREEAMAMARRGRKLVAAMFDAEANTARLYELYAAHAASATSEARPQGAGQAGARAED
ncbi:MAG: glycosyltransferase family 4 protein [Desulfovibrio sp.]|nr:glycosyltransferase family 4 protein [Desulfovibrio sp.]